MTISQSQVRNILRQVKPLACEYYKATKKPLGITGEVAEFEAAEKLGVKLTPPRAEGLDGVWRRGGRLEKVQIKGRAVLRDDPHKGRVGSIRHPDKCDIVLLVLLNKEDLDVLEIWYAPIGAVERRLNTGDSKARNQRRSLQISQFTSIEEAKQVWPKSMRHSHRS